MFKRCTNCAKAWSDRNAFISDPNVKIIGYQVNFEALQLGYYLFNHLDCHTTLAIHAAQFVDLYNGPIYTKSKAGTENCSEHCLHKSDLSPCAEECECAYVREIIQVLQNWPSMHDHADGSQLALRA